MLLKDTAVFSSIHSAFRAKSQRSQLIALKASPHHDSLPTTFETRSKAVRMEPLTFHPSHHYPPCPCSSNFHRGLITPTDLRFRFHYIRNVNLRYKLEPKYK